MLIQPDMAGPSQGSGGAAFVKLLLGVLAVGTVAYGVSRAVEESDTYWDSSVGRRRGSDGRFRSS